MYPDQNPNQPQYSIDYLNQIAPKPQKPGLSNKLFLLVVGGGVLLALIVGIWMIAGGGKQGPTQKMETLAARLLTLQKITDASQKTIESGDLQGINSSLSIFLTNANHDIVGPLQENGVEIKKIDKKITLAENGAALTQKLEDARLNAVFDRTYVSEMGYQLDTVTALIKDIYTHTKNKDLQAFLIATDNNLQPIKKQLQAFNPTGV